MSIKEDSIRINLMVKAQLNGSQARNLKGNEKKGVYKKE